jgi:ribosomal protein L35AE/L33A
VYIEECKLIGKIETSFGNSGKVKVTFKDSIEGLISEGA